MPSSGLRRPDMTADHGRRMIEYIGQELLRRPDTQIDETTPLISSGLIDSLELVDIVLKLEELTNLRIPAGIRRYVRDRKSTRLNSSHLVISYAVFCLKKKKSNTLTRRRIMTST